jgi:hypothetical protein
VAVSTFAAITSSAEHGEEEPAPYRLEHHKRDREAERDRAQKEDDLRAGLMYVSKPSQSGPSRRKPIPT